MRESLQRGFSQKWVRWCFRLRWPILLGWAAIAMAGYLWGIKFLGSTVSNFPAPKGSPAARAEAILNTHFPQLARSGTETLLLQSKTGALVTEDPLKTRLTMFEIDFQTKLQQQWGTSVVMVSYFTLVGLVPELVAPLLSDDRTGAIVVISYPGTLRDAENSRFLIFMEEQAALLIKQHGLERDVSFGLTGLDSLGLDMSRGIRRDSKVMDTMVLPLALLILALVVQSLPLMALPFLTLPVTLMLQFVIMYPISQKIDVVAFAPTTMISVTIALGVDYTLFLLTRLMDGLRLKLSLFDSVVFMVRSAGYTILVSGLTLCMSFMGLAMLPLESFRTMGLSASVTIFSALLVNLTMAPALLFTIGPHLIHAHFYINDRCARLWAYIRGGGRAKAQNAEPQQLMEAEPEEGHMDVITDEQGEVDTKMQAELNANGPKAVDVHQHGYKEAARVKAESAAAPASRSRSDVEHDDDAYDPGTQPGFWLSLAKFILHSRKRGVLVLLGILALLMPAMLQTLHIKTSVEMKLMLPYGCGSYDTLEAITQGFGGTGAVFPYTLVMVDNSNTLPDGFVSASGYEAMTAVIKALVKKVPGTALSDFTGLVALNGKWVAYEDMANAITNTTAAPGTYDFTLAQVNYRTISRNGNAAATYLMVAPKINPYSQAGQQWLENTRVVLSSMENVVNLQITIGGVAATIHDAVEVVMNDFPLMLGVTLLVVFVVMGLSFRSVVAPLRSVLTISLTLAVVYGVAKLIYQDGILDWLGVRALSKIGSLSWIPTILNFSIIVGLSLDYDVFLVARVLEYRQEGFTEKEAIIRGMVSTGHIITAAGIVMAVAFAGLFLSSQLTLNQTAFLLAFAVLLDTFVVRSLMVPILMELTGKYTWWPRWDLPVPKALLPALTAPIDRQEQQ